MFCFLNCAILSAPCCVAVSRCILHRTTHSANITNMPNMPYVTICHICFLHFFATHPTQRTQMSSPTEHIWQVLRHPCLSLEFEGETTGVFHEYTNHPSSPCSVRSVLEVYTDAADADWGASKMTRCCISYSAMKGLVRKKLGLSSHMIMSIM